jgi:NADPH:quinone reductase-like Zn-dependent oxidoreductase
VRDLPYTRRARSVVAFGAVWSWSSTGRLEVPIARTYPLAEVQDAYRELEQRYTLDKIVLVA